MEDGIYIYIYNCAKRLKADVGKKIKLFLFFGGVTSLIVLRLS